MIPLNAVPEFLLMGVVSFVSLSIKDEIWILLLNISNLQHVVIFFNQDMKSMQKIQKNPARLLGYALVVASTEGCITFTYCCLQYTVLIYTKANFKSVTQGCCTNHN